MHRRRSSKDTINEQENHQVLGESNDSFRTSDNISFPQKNKSTSISFPGGGSENVPPESGGTSPLRIRVNSVPSQPPVNDSEQQQQNQQQQHHHQQSSQTSIPPAPTYRAPPPSAGPYRTSFGSQVQGGSLPIPNASPLRKSFTQGYAHGHVRAMSSSGTFGFASPMSPPLYGSFPSRPVSISAVGGSPPKVNGSGAQGHAPPASPTTTRRPHQRIHSRNLSIYFPRPGSLPTSSIAEDGDGNNLYNGDSQEVSLNEATISDSTPKYKSVRLQNPPGPRRLGEGFTFGGKPPADVSSGPNMKGDINGDGSSVSRAKRRGHHHKHSLSHNFFSFLEPGSQQFPIHPTSSPSPEPSWTPASPAPNSSTFSHMQENGTAVGLTSPNLDHQISSMSSGKLPKDAVALAIVQFVLGAALWVSGQQDGSLACAGLGYWVVFDSFGVALKHILPVYLASKSMQSKTRRPYGNARIETLMLFAQTVYLIFSSVYVSKEAVEHLLLSAGGGHHHHHYVEDDVATDGVQIPLFLILMTVISLLSTCLFYDNHRRLITTSGHKLPSFSHLLRSSRSYIHSSHVSPATTILSNPFTLAPIVFSIALVGGALLLPVAQQESYDMLLALFTAVLTFKIAYPAAEVQGTVLLQTAPPRGMPGAKMEAFLRTMREIERHPLVLHLPAPHLWQLTPSSSIGFSSLKFKGDMTDATDSLVVTLELHVRRDTDDGELVTLTRWAHERCRLALGLGKDNHSGTGKDETEITIGIVKG